MENKAAALRIWRPLGGLERSQAWLEWWRECLSSRDPALPRCAGQPGSLDAAHSLPARLSSLQFQVEERVPAPAPSHPPSLDPDSGDWKWISPCVGEIRCTIITGAGRGGEAVRLDLIPSNVQTRGLSNTHCKS